MKRSYIVPAVLTLLSACIGVLTNVGTALLPASWKWMHNVRYVWGLTGALLLITIAAAAYQQKSAEREKAAKANELKSEDTGQADPVGISVSMTGSHLRIGTVLQATNSIVNLYESSAAADVNE